MANLDMFLGKSVSIADILIYQYGTFSTDNGFVFNARKNRFTGTVYIIMHYGWNQVADEFKHYFVKH